MSDTVTKEDEQERFERLCVSDPIPVVRALEGAEWTLKQIAALTDGMDGMTMQTAAMNGKSPMKLLGQGRDLAKSALIELEKL